MKKLVGGNFKMNLHTVEDINNYFGGFQGKISNDAVEVFVAPQFPMIYPAISQSASSGIEIGAQDMRYEESGAFTGQTSALCLKSLGVKYVIIGHGERRFFAKEDNQIVNKKTKAALAHGIRPVVCIGESLEQKESGQTETVLQKQITEGLEGIDSNLVDIAYEPLWAIGTGKTPTLEEIQSIHTYIRTLCGVESRILYGGSANDVNSPDIIRLNNVDGFLVGGASMDPTKFSKIVGACANN